MTISDKKSSECHTFMFRSFTMTTIFTLYTTPLLEGITCVDRRSLSLHSME